MIPQNMEKYIPLAVGQLKFIDSFQFTPKCLDVLAKSIADDDFRYLRESCTSNHFGLIRRKGVYPYDYVQCKVATLDIESTHLRGLFNARAVETAHV